MKSAIPADAEELSAVYSNFDHRIEEEVVRQLMEKPGKSVAQHAGWNFSGHVWYDNGQWFNETWCYRSPRHLFIGATVNDVIEQALDQHGRD